MKDSVLLTIDGEVDAPRQFTYDDLVHLDDQHQIRDVSRIEPSRRGDAVTLKGLLAMVNPRRAAQWLGLHGSANNFHASIPLESVPDTAFFIYRLDGAPLPEKSGGPVRFFIPDHAACQREEIDECANVKFVDHIELTAEKGFDNRPTDEEEHQRLHEH